MSTDIPKKVPRKQADVLEPYLHTRAGREKVLKSMVKPLEHSRWRLGNALLGGAFNRYALFSVLARMEEGELIPEECEDLIREALEGYFGRRGRYKPYSGDRPSLWEHLDDDTV